MIGDNPAADSKGANDAPSHRDISCWAVSACRCTELDAITVAEAILTPEGDFGEAVPFCLIESYLEFLKASSSLLIFSSRVAEPFCNLHSPLVLTGRRARRVRPRPPGRNRMPNRRSPSRRPLREQRRGRLPRPTPHHSRQERGQPRLALQALPQGSTGWYDCPSSFRARLG